MKKFEEIKFNIGVLKGISAKNIEEHLKLYVGYVKNTNLIIEKAELQTRFGFEFNGMRNHEYYFKSLEGGTKPLPVNSQLKLTIENSQLFDAWLTDFKTLAMTRGIGWAVLYYDKQTKQLIPTWVDEHHLGQLNGLNWILGIDMWEHAFVADYQPSGKKQYIEDFFANLNWEVIEENFKKAL